MGTDPAISGEETSETDEAVTSGDASQPTVVAPEAEDEALDAAIAQLESDNDAVAVADAEPEDEAAPAQPDDDEAATTEPAPAQPDDDEAATTQPVTAQPTAAEESPAEAPPSDEASPAERQSEDAAQLAESSVVAVGFDGGRPAVPWWPFLSYIGLWAVFAGVLAWQLLELPAGSSAYVSSIYPLTVFGGLTLTAAGPILLLAVWALTGKAGRRGSTFVTALVRGAASTMFGVVLWWAALLAVDAIRLGTLF